MVHLAKTFRVIFVFLVVMYHKSRSSFKYFVSILCFKLFVNAFVFLLKSEKLP